MPASYRESRKGIGGRPKGAPTTVVRLPLPLPVAALAKRLADGSLTRGVLAGLFGVEARTAMTVPLVLSTGQLRLSEPGRRLSGQGARLQRAADRQPVGDVRRLDRRR